jgi:hypothetical protein
VILAVILISIVLFFIFKGQNDFSFKPKGVKKEEISQNYINELKDILSSCDTKEEKIAKKKLFIQKTNSELSRNIFFSEEESKDLLKKLSVV